MLGEAKYDFGFAEGNTKVGWWDLFYVQVDQNQNEFYVDFTHIRSNN